MKATEIFTPTGLPNVTLIKEHLETPTKSLALALEAGGYLVSLVGPSKSGKTVFIEDQIGKANLIHVTGAGIESAEALWRRVFHIIGTPIEKQSSNTTANQLTGTLKGTVGVKAFLTASTEGSVGAQKTDTTSQTEKEAIDFLQLLIKELKGSGYTLFIDDFHYVNKEAQTPIAEQIKEAVRQGLTIVCAAVPYHSDDVIRSNRDLSGRIMKLDFAYWKKDQLMQIANRGFEALNITCPIGLASDLADEAAGSPQLMQALCLATCIAAGASQRPSNRLKLPETSEFKTAICSAAVLTTDFASVAAKMREGPKTRGTDRTSHLVKSGTFEGVEDVYPIVVRALQADPPKLTLRYEDLKDRIAALCPNGTPSGSSVTGACGHMTKLANEQANCMLLEWDGKNDVLDIRDPYLLFYIRWTGR